MKKNLVIGIVAVVVIALLVGGILFFKGVKKTVQAPQGDVKIEKLAKSGDEGGGLLDTAEKIKDAMLGGKKMECVFMDDAGDGKQVEMKMQSQGEKFRSSYTVNGETFVSVSDGEVIYSWSSKTKEGSKIDLKCMEDFSKDAPPFENMVKEETNFESPEELVAKEPNMKCAPVSDIDFSVPTDVKFADTCAEMKKLFDSMKGLNANIPEGVGLPPTTE